ncbi:MAG: peptidoglycan DD-metalloendopeptidase family protein [Paludibacteraceae bacterium]|nr:peptidoglycan DD-metalloendopeptidase family protein [Paludibacteraceae bacterium]
MKRFILYIVVLLTFSACATKPAQHCAEEEPVAEVFQPRVAYGIALDDYRIDTCRVLTGETLSGILNRHGLTAKQWRDMQPFLKQHPEMASIREGGRYYAFRNDTALCYYAYRLNRRETLIASLLDSFYLWRDTLPQLTERRKAEFTITSSLWQAINSQDLPVELALELSEIYAWTINFFALQQGDSVRVLYDELFIDGARVGIGRIYAAHFYHGKRWLPAYFADAEGLQPFLADSLPDLSKIHNYFDADGNSLRKTFLKAPLNYKRISSTFSYARKHPIYHTVRPHTGVDYAAPMGTPVVALGDGVVTFRAYKGGGGNTIRIRHNSTYETGYLHLSKYAKGLQVGQYVKQGEVIGYVGSTGASTGPHLDFRVWKNGQPVNPLTLDSPPAEPIPADLRQAYDSLAMHYNQILLSSGCE